MYYIAVGGRANSYFLLLAGYSQDNVTLMAGVPFTDSAAAGELRHMRLITEIDDGTKAPNIEFTVSSGSGTRPYITISTLGYPAPPSNAGDWSDVGYNGLATITIRPDHAKYCKRCTYYITVKEYTNLPFEFTIVGAPGGTTTLLQDGIAQSGSVAVDEVVYYSFILNLQQDLIIELTSTSGDADLYVSRVDRRPSSTNATWSSESPFSDSVTVYTDDNDYCFNCEYFIAVLGFSAAEFSITAYHSSSTRDVVLGTFYEVTEAKAAQYTYFEVTVAGLQGGLTFTCSPTEGYPYMYISTKGIPDPGTPQFPPMWQASGYPAVKPISVGQENVCTSCTYYIAIGSQWSQTSFTFQVIENGQPEQLRLGLPTYGQIPSTGFKYYYARFPSALSSALIEVTSFSDDPDIYISNNCTNPSRECNYKSSTLWGADSITLTPGDLASCPGCNWYIAVENYASSRLTYTITASQGSSGLQLREGSPLEDRILANETRNIQLIVTTPGRLTITASSTLGTPNLFMAPLGPDNTFPVPFSRTTYKWSATVGNPVVLTAAEGDTGFCTTPPCTYAITVSPRANAIVTDLHYTITAVVGDQVVTLQPGRPQYDSVQPQKYRYYVFYPADITLPVVVSVTALAGDPDLYVSRNYQRPNSTAGFYEWEENSFGDDNLVISPNADTKACQVTDAATCVYYIGIKNFNWYGSSSYTITVSQAGRFIELLNGVPQQSYVDPTPGFMQYFAVTMPPVVNDRITITVTPRRGIPDLYVSRSTDKVIRANDTSSYQWSSTHGVPVIVTIHPDEGSGFCSNCVFYIGVGPHANSTNKITFSIQASGANETISLQPGVPQLGSITSQSFAYFEVALPSAVNANGGVDLHRNDLHISVTPLAGRDDDPDILVACGNTTRQPNWGSFTWISAASGADEMIIRASDTDYCSPNDVFVIGVTDIVSSSNTEAVTFLISVFESDGWAMLQDGFPMAAQASANGTRRYRFAVDGGGAPLDSITFTITPENVGTFTLMSSNSLLHPEYEIGDGLFPVQGNSSTYDRAITRSSVSAVMTINKEDKDFCKGCDYFLTVFNSAPVTAQYTITAATSRGATLLEAGVPTQGRSRPGIETKFVFFVSKVTQDVTFSVSVVSGDASLVIGLADETVQWMVPSLAETDTLTVPKSEITPHCTANCRFLVSVVGAEWPQPVRDPRAPVSFIVAASLADDITYLTSGVPAVVSTAGQKLRRFRVSVPTGNTGGLTLSATAATKITIMANLASTTTGPRNSRNPDVYPSVVHPGTINSRTEFNVWVGITAEQLAKVDSVLISVNTTESAVTCYFFFFLHIF